MYKGSTNNLEHQRNFDKFNISDPNLVCENGNFITHLCINPICTLSSLICGQRDCEICGKTQHRKCERVDLQAVTEMIQERTENLTAFFKALCDVEDNLINMIKKNKKSMARRYYLGSLEKKYQHIVEEIYEKGNRDYIVGKQAKQFYQRLCEQEEQRIDDLQERLLVQFNQDAEKIFQQLLAKKETACLSLSMNKTSVYSRSNLQAHGLSRTEIQRIERFKIDSKILMDPKVGNTLQQQQFILSALRHPKHLKLLYRASQNNFLAVKFHQKCDKAQHTLTILRTQFGKTIAGYTDQPWDPKTGDMKGDNGGSFLLSIDLKQKMFLQQNKEAIRCYQQLGPFFGDSDISIYDRCNVNGCRCWFPGNYNFKQPCERSMATWNALTGAIKTSHLGQCVEFKITEYEVFEIIWE